MADLLIIGRYAIRDEHVFSRLHASLYLLVPVNHDHVVAGLQELASLVMFVVLGQYFTKLDGRLYEKYQRTGRIPH
jgi:hypothetical protein